MKRSFLLISFVACFFACFGQGNRPIWMESVGRDALFPSQSFITGFSSERVQNPNDLSRITEHVIADAQRLLLENIRMRIVSQTELADHSRKIDGREQISTTFNARTQTFSEAKLVGIKTEFYFDANARIVYAFAQVNRFELIGYYKTDLRINLSQMEGLLQTAQNLENNNEKTKARQQTETAKPLLENIRYAQGLLIAIDANISAEDLQLQKTESLHNALTQMQARLAQGVFVYMQSAEMNLSRRSSVIGNRLKSALSERGCSFVDNLSQADWHIIITAETRFHNETHGFMVYYADVKINLIDTHRDRSVFQDEFSQKGIATTQENASRKALEDAVPVIVEKLSQWIK